MSKSMSKHHSTTKCYKIISNHLHGNKCSNKIEIYSINLVILWHLSGINYKENNSALYIDIWKQTITASNCLFPNIYVQCAKSANVYRACNFAYKHLSFQKP